jgi:DNA (cytosine-5)-methyltransferase 1
MPIRKNVVAADLFCGAGGTSYGFTRAALKRGLIPNLIAINHWKTAIQSHSENLNYAKHLCMSLDNINPREAVPGGHLDLLMASPECTHHSQAAGGRPKNAQSRATAFHVIKWAMELSIDSILVENVPEFLSWGRLTKAGKVDKRHKGELFLAWVKALEALGYSVDWRVLCCADYGDATTRKRLFIQARKKPSKITWPEPSHASEEELKSDSGDLFVVDRKPWRAAREIIDWSIKSKSIFGRKKPHAQKTLKRIMAGLNKFLGENAKPFLLMLYGTGMVRDVDLPLPTVTAGGQHIALCQPFIVNMKGKSTARSINKPLVTQTTQIHQYLCEPFMLGQQSGSAPRSTSKPVPTVATKGAIALIEPTLEPLSFIIPIDQQGGGDGGATGVNSPISTITTKARHALIETELKPFLVTVGGTEGQGRHPKSVDAPLATVLTENHTAVVEPFLMAINHKDKSESGQRCFSPDSPLGTLTTKGSFTVIEPTAEPIDGSFLIKYGTGGASSVEQHLDTVTTKDRFGLVTISGKNYGVWTTNGQQYLLDIRLRMLEPKELAGAHSMDDYIFFGNRGEQVKQVGNSVPSKTAERLAGNILDDFCSEVDETVDIPAALNWLERHPPVSTKRKKKAKAVAVAA